VKKLILLFLVVLFFDAAAQSSRYSRRELKVLVAKQQAKINELLAQVEQLSISHDQYLKTDKFECMRRLSFLLDSLKIKDEHISRVKQENEYLKNYLKVVKQELEAKNHISPPQPISTGPKINTARKNKYSLYDDGVETVIRRSDRRTYITGPRGGCYYINGNGNKTYVDRSLCH
jgi:hypothetical protein